ncbi:hypothetical protein O3W44_23715 [Pantoea sp. LMR881]|uniref:hypothetical protein n=1 Tax=Pantoea sp. LMR881 TaxID=3014336 RepID=UPI0022AEA7A3|nr:hypothetical protein [Pantoea sp. LMR881]MCZ4061502.1 hypothetical protein [Pantoea sp. LMR881]
MQFSGKSGTSAMQLSFAMVKAGMAQHSLAIGADTISRHTAPGDLTEAYTGAGAVVVLFDTDKVIAEVDETFSLRKIRPQGNCYIRSGMSLGSDKTILASIGI